MSDNYLPVIRVGVCRWHCEFFMPEASSRCMCGDKPMAVFNVPNPKLGTREWERNYAHPPNGPLMAAYILNARRRLKLILRGSDAWPVSRKRFRKRARQHAREYFRIQWLMGFPTVRPRKLLTSEEAVASIQKQYGRSIETLAY